MTQSINSYVREVKKVYQTLSTWLGIEFRQDLAIQGVECVLAMHSVCVIQVLRVYCSRCAVCILRHVLCVLYRV